jgi:DNA-binding PadR family transcriptional regulator
MTQHCLENERGFFKDFKKRFVNQFKDILILAGLIKRPMSGYDVISYIFSNYGFLASSGSVYSTLYALEREELIKGHWSGRKRNYKLTEKGKAYIQEYANNVDAAIRFSTQFLKSVQATQDKLLVEESVTHSLGKWINHY